MAEANLDKVTNELADQLIRELSEKDWEIVTRCKDCVYFHRRQTMFGKEYTECERAFTTSQPGENDYCSWGKQK